MYSNKEVTITEHLLYQQKLSPEATGRFTQLMNDLVFASKIVSREVTKAGLVDVLGFTGETNIQGERVKKLDQYANDIFMRRMERSGAICAMASEEMEDYVVVSERFQRGDYILIFDPLDGSSNIDANVNIGTIFSILRRNSSFDEPKLDDILQKGTEQVGAGYILYGSSTMMVMTTGHGVHGFTLDPSVGEFLLSHEFMQIPAQSSIYSVNEGYWNLWDEPTRDAVSYFKSTDNPRGKPHSLRYIGSLVADFHRNLLYGGIFMYPADYRDPQNPKGKLRLMYEANPLAFIIEQAGGLATDGRRRILDIEPESLHQRVPLFIGSEQDVRKVSDIYRKFDAKR